MNKFGTRQYVTVVWLMMLATMTLFTTVGVESKSITTIAKYLFAGALWGVTMLYPYKYFGNNDLGKFANRIIFLIVFLTLIAVIRTIVTPLKGPVGSKWSTLFGNQDTMFMLLTPCFIMLSQGLRSLPVLKRASEVYIFLGFFALFMGNLYPIYSILWFSGLFFPYMGKKFEILFLLSLAAAIFSAFFLGEHTNRSVIIIFGILIITYVCVYVIKRKKILWIVCLSMIFVPIIYSFLTLFIPEFSAVQIALETLMNRTGDQTLTADTRTFLFHEVAEDLTANNAWLLGKGAVSFYYSDYFARSTSGDGDFWMRISVEVSLLQFLLRSGIIYVISYFSLIIYAVVKALKKSQNKFVLSAAFVASGWVLYSCITYLNGCNFIHVGFFLLLGCCMSKRWLSYTDDDIKKILRR